MTHETGCYAQRQRDEIEVLQSIFPQEFRFDDPKKKIWGKLVPASFSILVSIRELLSKNSDVEETTLPSVRLHVIFTPSYPRTSPIVDLSEPQNMTKQEETKLRAIIESSLKSLEGTEVVYELFTTTQATLKDSLRIRPQSLNDERADRLKAIVEKRSAEESRRRMEALETKSLEDAKIRQQISDEMEAQQTNLSQKADMAQSYELSEPQSMRIDLDSPLKLGSIAVRSLLLSVPTTVDDRSRTKPWLSFVPGFGTVIVKEFCLEKHDHELLREIETTIAMYQERMKSMVKVTNHAYTISITDDLCRLYLVQKHVPSGSLQDFLQVTKTISLALAKRWLIDLSEELILAHRMGLTHDHICSSKIMLIRMDGRIVASLCDWRLSFLVRRSSESCSESGLKLAADTTDRIIQPSDDLVQLLYVFLQMLVNVELDRRGSIEGILNDHQTDLVEEVRIFLRDVLISSKRQRLTASDLLAMEFLRVLSTQHLQQLKETGMSSSIHSRYLLDFEELSRIGQGAYGIVVKARNRLDGRVYAIKKIRTHAESRVLREVSGLARLHHPSIVRYFGSWVEHHSAAVQNSIDGDSTDDESGDELFSEDFMSVSGIVFANSPSTSAATMGHVDKLQHSLFIQMEYCSGDSLRVLIDERKVGVLYWSYFTQIADGVRYIHEQGLIHRDLKPANIFVSSDGLLKLGDFGLVMENAVESGPQSSHIDPANDHTGEVGTFLYQAPELLCQHPNYDYKVDLYALGIILGEMICPWSTGMERVLIIRGLRSPQISCSLDASRFRRELDILRSLLNHDPRLRPSAQSLVDMLPPVIHRPRLQDTLKLLTEDRVFCSDVLTYFFSERSTLSEFTYDMQNLAITTATTLATEKVVAIVHQIFRAHGGISRDRWTNALIPYNSTYQSHDPVVKLLDEAANVLQLPFDFKVPFARQLARTDVRTRLERSFVVGPVYRNSDGRATSLIEADFDIVERSSWPTIISGIETTRVLFEIVVEIPVPKNFYLVLGHAAIGRAIMRKAYVPDELASRVLRILVALTHSSKKRSLARWRQALVGVLPQSSILELHKYQAIDEVAFEEQLIRIVESCDQDTTEVKKATAELLSFFSSAKTWGIDLPMTFRPFTSAPHLFELTYTLVSNFSATDIVAVGGSYKRLIDSMKLPGVSEAAPQVFGFSLAIDKLAKIVHDNDRDTAEAAQVDVVISARAHEALATDLILRLWTAHVSAELCYEEDAMALCLERNAKFLLTLKEKRHMSTNAQFVKVKRVNTVSSEAEDVNFESVPQYLLAELSELSKNVRKSMVPKLERTSTSRKEPEVIFLGGEEQRKQKLSQRDAISSKAIDCARALSDQLVNANIPIIVVELDAEHIQLLRSLNPRSSDESQVKRISEQMTNAVTRLHFANIRQTISRLQDAGKSYCLLYSFKCSELVWIPL